MRLVGRCTVLAERVFTAAEDWGAGEIVTRFLGRLEDMTEDSVESPAHLGTSPRPKKATLSEEILRKGLGDIRNCPIPHELWDRLIPVGVPDRLHGVCRPAGKGYPSPETEVMLVVVRGEGVFPRGNSNRKSHGSLFVPLFSFPRITLRCP